MGGIETKEKEGKEERMPGKEEEREREVNQEPGDKVLRKKYIYETEKQKEEMEEEEQRERNVRGQVIAINKILISRKHKKETDEEEKKQKEREEEKKTKETRW